jgi:hypothetical protein
MKGKTSSTKALTPFSRRIALLGCSLLALSVFAPPVGATLVLDNFDQTVAAPLSGTTIVDFSGTVTLDSNAHFDVTMFVLVNPLNLSLSNLLVATPTVEFLAFLNTPAQPFFQTFTGSIFDVSVPAGTPPDLYGFDSQGFPAEIELVSVFDDGTLAEIDRAEFRIQVTGVPDRGSSILLLGLSLAALCSFHALRRLVV